MCYCWVRHQVLLALTACLFCILCNVLIMHYCFVCLQIRPPLKLTDSSRQHESTILPRNWQNSKDRHNRLRFIRQTALNETDTELLPDSASSSLDRNINESVIVENNELLTAENDPKVTDTLIQTIMSTLPITTTVASTTPLPTTTTTQRITSTTTTTMAQEMITVEVQKTATMIHNETLPDFDENRQYLPNFWIEIDETLLASVVGITATITCPIWYVIIASSGARIPLCVVTIVSGVLVAVRPFLFHVASLWPLFSLQALMGCALGIVFPMIGSVIAVWSSAKTRASFLTVCLMSTCVAPAVLFTSMALLMNTSEHDDMVDYDQRFLVIASVSGGLGLFSVIIGVVWLLIDRDTPQKHPFITGQEIDRLLTGKGRILLDESHDLNQTPWKSILTSLPIWISQLSIFARSSCFVWLLYAAPLIMRNQMPSVNAVDNGLTVGIAFLAQFFVAILIGVFGHRPLVFRNETRKTKSFNFVSHFLCSAALAVMSLLKIVDLLKFFPTNSLILAGLFLGFDLAGCWRQLCLYSRQWTCQVLVCGGTLFGLAWALVPWLQWATLDCWHWGQLAIAGLMLLSAILFVAFSESCPAKWSEQSTIYNRDSNDNLSLEAGIIEMRQLSTVRRSN